MISIVVPVYRSKDTLERCVKSLCDQIYEDLEILLVDDGSADGSGELCEKLASQDKRIRVIHKENGGVSSARNAGIEAAAGEFLMFSDSDDYMEPEMCQRMMDNLGEDDIVICGFHHHYQGRDVIRVPKINSQDGEKNFLALYGQGFLNMPWNKLYRKKLAGRFDEDLSLGEDLLFNLDYLHRTDGVSVIRAPLCHYIQDETGKSLSACPRNDRLETGKRIRNAADDFFLELSGHYDESGIINARLVQEVLDDVESLPFDQERTREEKLEVIDEYCKDGELRRASEKVALKKLDYRLIHFCMRRGWKSLAYDLSSIRAWLVKLRGRDTAVKRKSGRNVKKRETGWVICFR